MKERRARLRAEEHDPRLDCLDAAYALIQEPCNGWWIFGGHTWRPVIRAAQSVYQQCSWCYDRRVVDTRVPGSGYAAPPAEALSWLKGGAWEDPARNLPSAPLQSVMRARGSGHPRP